jgi:hypothetical protein
MKKTTFTAETIVAFHIGRGGRFYNGGHLTFLGEGKISDYTEDCWPPVKIDENSDSDLPEPIDDNSPEAEWTDCNGNSVGLTNAEYQSGIGRIDIDGEYNTTYTMRLGDIEEDSKEWDAIFADNTSDAEDAQMFFFGQEECQASEEDQETVIAAVLAAADEELEDVEVSGAVKNSELTMYTVEYGYRTIKAIKYHDSDIVFLPKDWQGFMPENLWDVKDCEWEAEGREGIILEHFPRFL